MDELWVCQAGLIEYREALALQERLRDARQAGAIPDTMLLLEHPPVITRGRRAGADDLPLPEAWYRQRGLDIVEVNRGGKLTLHNPGQLVGYPIVAVTDVVDYVRRLEQALISGLFEQGVLARARPQDGPDFTGVWVDERKIASIGVHVARGVTTHGFALNVVNDMEPWTWFTACGLASVQMTRVAAELDPAPDLAGAGATRLMACMRKRVAFAVAQSLGRRQRAVTRAALERALKSSISVTPAGPGADPAPQYA
ncbi:MAG TPA: lipoyl(octanoyl) transferase LipB [Solirubrobacteraceae bacterium]|nr:lipoyl(octanoyl) transferase LipB [Solirubrobacteraceae bacterium]